MSTNLYCHIELKIGGKWQHYALMTPQYYSLFAKMADVRNPGNIDPISKPKGLPGDASDITHINHWTHVADAYGGSWLDSSEILILALSGKELFPNALELEDNWFAAMFGYLLGCRIDLYLKTTRIKAEFRAIGIYDIRFVFFFTN